MHYFIKEGKIFLHVAYFNRQNYIPKYGISVFIESYPMKVILQCTYIRTYNIGTLPNPTYYINVIA